MLAEVLLVLAGHPSAFFVPTPNVSPTTFSIASSLTEYLHPGETVSLNTLGQLAFDYTKARDWATRTVARSREAVLAESLSASRKGKGRAVDEALATNDALGVYYSVLATGVLHALRDYELLVIEVEAKVLSMDPSMVQDERGYVPLSALVASFTPWHSRLAALASLAGRLADVGSAAGSSTGGAKSPGQLMELLTDLQHTGDPELERIFTKCLDDLHRLFLTHLVSFILYGQVSTTTTPYSPALGLDAGPDPLAPQHRAYKLNEALLPRSVRHGTRESILYVGRVAATLKREGRSLPKVMVDELRATIMAIPGLSDSHGFEAVINRVRGDVGEWLWRHVLTGPQIIEALEAFGHYFLTLRGEYTSQLVRELRRLQAEKLLRDPSSSSAVIREQDLGLVLLRASVGTPAETDRAVEKLRFRLPGGSIRPLSTHAGDAERVEYDDQNGGLFASSLLGQPLVLSMSISWPLDLFITPPALKVYAEIHSYLLAIRDTHLRLQDAWALLTLSRRRSGTGHRAPLSVEEEKANRASWTLLRSMLFFVDQLERHFLSDVVDDGHRKLLSQLQAEDHQLHHSTSLSGSLGASTARPASRGGASNNVATWTAAAEPASPATPSHANLDAQTTRTMQTVRSSRVALPRNVNAAQHDFLSMRTMHAQHLAALREGLLLVDKQMTALIRDILHICKRFAGLIIRWDGELSEREAAKDGNRLQQVMEIKEETQALLVDFFGLLVDSQNPPTATDDASSAGRGADRSFSRTMRATQISRLISRQMSFGAGAKITGAHGAGLPGAKGAESRVERTLTADGSGLGKHVEQLLLRMDWNNVLTAWRQEGETGGISRAVLAEGGLQP